MGNSFQQRKPTLYEIRGIIVNDNIRYISLLNSKFIITWKILLGMYTEHESEVYVSSPSE